MQDDSQPNVLEKKEAPATLPDDTTTGLPLDIVLSLLRPDEVEKVRNYIATYLEKHSSNAA